MEVVDLLIIICQLFLHHLEHYSLTFRALQQFVNLAFSDLEVVRFVQRLLAALLHLFERGPDPVDLQVHILNDLVLELRETFLHQFVGVVEWIVVVVCGLLLS